MNALTTILTVFLWYCSVPFSHDYVPPTAHINEVTHKEGVYYFNDRIFNGNIIDYYENKKLKFTYQVTEGRLNGQATMYYASGKIKSTRNYIIGKLFGEFREYYESGEIRASFDVKLNAYGSGEKIVDITIGTMKRGKHKFRNYENGLIFFINTNGEHFRSSESISIPDQTVYIIMDDQKEETLLKVN